MAAIVNDRHSILGAGILRVESPVVNITSTGSTFTINSAGTVVTPSSIVFTASNVGFVTPTYAWYRKIGSGSETTISGATTNVLTVTADAGFIAAVGLNTLVAYRVELIESGRTTTSASTYIPIVRDGGTGADGADATVYSIWASSPVIYKDAVDAATAGTYTTITLQGKRTIGSTTTNFGFITTTENGGAESSRTDTSSSALSYTMSAGKSSVTIKCYSAISGGTLLDTKVISTVFKGDNGNSPWAISYTNGSHTAPVTNLGVATWTGSGGNIQVFDGNTLLVLKSNTQSTTTPAVTTENGKYVLNITKIVGDTLTIGSITGQTTTTATLASWAGTLTTVTVYRITAYIRSLDGTAVVASTDVTITPGNQGADSTVYSIWASSPVIYKDAPDAATAGTYTTITLQGKKTVGSTTTNFGFITTTENGSAESARTDTSSSALSYTMSAGKSSVTIKCYSAVSGGTLLDTQVINTVYKGVVGNTAVFAYKVLNSTSLPSSPTIGGSTTPNNGPCTDYVNWFLEPKTTLATNDWQFQVSGTKSPAGVYTWNPTTGYLSTFKVGKLEALSSKLGNVEIDTVGSLYSTGKTYGGSANGYFLGYSGGQYKFDIGNQLSYFRWDGSALATKYNSYKYNLSLGVVGYAAPFTIERKIDNNIVLSLSDSKIFYINATTSGVNTITMDAVSHDYLDFLNTVGTQIKFLSTFAGIVAGTSYYINSVDLVNKTFKISTSPSGSPAMSLSSTSGSKIGYVPIAKTISLMDISANTGNAGVSLSNKSDYTSVRALDLICKQETGGSTLSEVQIATANEALNLVQGGVRFPAIFTNSTNANNLDDYYEGTWTPTITATGVTTKSFSNARYTKIGRGVFFNVAFTFSNPGSSGNVQFTLPTTPTISTTFEVFFLNGSNPTSVQRVIAWCTAGSNTADIDRITTSYDSRGSDFATFVTSSTDLRISGFYC